MKKTISIFLLAFVLSGVTLLYAETSDFGAGAARADRNLTVEEMPTY